jgi:hypothetical protein
MIRAEKERRWKEFVEEIDRKTSVKDTWRTIRNLDGRHAPRKDNEVLVVDGKGIVEDKDKAHQFKKTYKMQSRIPREKSDKQIKHNNRSFLKEKPDTIEPCEQDLKMEEFERVLKETSDNKAAGIDDAPYELLKHMGPKAKTLILFIYNMIWRGGEIPQKWRTALIKPLLKDGKDPTLTSSYRPISLTVCLGKVMEKMIADRLSNILEERHQINDNQAGFRRNRCTADQVLKVVQAATDEIHKKRGGALGVIFFDFEKAYDKVWRDGLIHKMIQMKIPYRFIKYVRNFLSARRTWVDVNGVKSDQFYLNEGLPQGSAISPLLFLIFINDIDEEIEITPTPACLQMTQERGLSKEKTRRRRLEECRTR